jgi:pimeloyl-ACP methyl ester carboxylesterase
MRPLAKTTVPAMYVHGVDDGCVGIEMADGVERAYAGGIEVHRIEGAGHFVHLERPDRFNELMLRFLE